MRHGRYRARDRRKLSSCLSRLFPAPLNTPLPFGPGLRSVETPSGSAFDCLARVLNQPKTATGESRCRQCSTPTMTGKCCRNVPGTDGWKIPRVVDISAPCCITSATQRRETVVRDQVHDGHIVFRANTAIIAALSENARASGYSVSEYLRAIVREKVGL